MSVASLVIIKLLVTEYPGSKRIVKIILWLRDIHDLTMLRFNNAQILLLLRMGDTPIIASSMLTTSHFFGSLCFLRLCGCVQNTSCMASVRDLCPSGPTFPLGIGPVLKYLLWVRPSLGRTQTCSRYIRKTAIYLCLG
jgi:hypothetical protein